MVGAEAEDEHEDPAPRLAEVEEDHPSSMCCCCPPSVPRSRLGMARTREGLDMELAVETVQVWSEISLP